LKNQAHWVYCVCSYPPQPEGTDVNQGRSKVFGVIKLAFAGIALAALAPGAISVHAQQVTTLIQFTNVWSYDQSGRELGTAWRTNDYDDSAWPSGRGLLGREPDTPGQYSMHAPISTPLDVSVTVTTFYFRTTFEFTGGTAGLSLIASTLVDDGCAIYLNGARVGGVRIPAGYNAPNAAQFFAGGTEGTLEIVTFTNVSALRVGQNLLAVEVHQSSSPSSDVMFGMKLVAVQQTPLAITNQPQDRIVTVGDSVTFTVGVSGGPAFYRWDKGGVVHPSTSNTLTISNAQLANAGDYRVIITNSVSAVTSRVATLTVVSDREGPRLLAAIGNNTPVGGGSAFGSNTVNVFFSEPVEAPSARNTNNYVLTRLGTVNTVPILSGLYSTALGALLIVDGSDLDWVPGGDYVLTVSGVKDTRGNVIAPGSQSAVSWRHTRSVIQFTDSWRFHDISIFEPEVFETNWYACDFVERLWWGEGSAPFCGGVMPPFQIPSPCSECATPISFQPAPTLFRKWFIGRQMFPPRTPPCACASPLMTGRSFTSTVLKSPAITCLGTMSLLPRAVPSFGFQTPIA
jgi:hypothetical protein